MSDLSQPNPNVLVDSVTTDRTDPLSSYAFSEHGDDAKLYNGVHDLEAELAKLRTERDAAQIASNLSHEAARLATEQRDALRAHLAEQQQVNVELFNRFKTRQERCDRLLILCGKMREVSEETVKLNEKFTEHTRAVGEFLAEMYQVMFGSSYDAEKIAKTADSVLRLCEGMRGLLTSGHLEITTLGQEMEVEFVLSRLLQQANEVLGEVTRNQ